MKQILMIHEITEDLFRIDLEKYILTFDDGLYSQYLYFDSHIKHLDTEKIFFISTGIIGGQHQNISSISSITAHQKAFLGNTEDFMTLEQIQYLANQPQVIIGGHSHSHIRLNQFTDKKSMIDHIKQDTEIMLEWFKVNMNYRPEHFCFPYNEDPYNLYRAVLKRYGFRYYFGQGDRLDCQDPSFLVEQQ